VKKLLSDRNNKIASETVYSDLPVVPKGMILKTANVVLNDEQKNALEAIEKQIDAQKFSVALLHGVTDSGKTEVYIRAIEKSLEKGKSAIVLLPEIALTAQTIQRFSTRFDKLAVLHSQLTASQRNAQWQKIPNTSRLLWLAPAARFLRLCRNLALSLLMKNTSRATNRIRLRDNKAEMSR
jgi:primosomal protein N' (replication factor Y)